MTVVRRTNPDVGASLCLGGEQARERGDQGAVRTIEARWLVSRQAVSAKRPELRIAGESSEITLAWRVMIRGAGASAELVEARAVLRGDSPGSDVVLVKLDQGEGAFCIRLADDPGGGITSIDLLRGTVVLLSLSVRMHGEGENGARSEVTYARTWLLSTAAAPALGVGGGRYEFDGGELCEGGPG